MQYLLRCNCWLHESVPRAVTVCDLQRCLSCMWFAVLIFRCIWFATVLFYAYVLQYLLRCNYWLHEPVPTAVTVTVCDLLYGFSCFRICSTYCVATVIRMWIAVFTIHCTRFAMVPFRHVNCCTHCPLLFICNDTIFCMWFAVFTKLQPQSSCELQSLLSVACDLQRYYSLHTICNLYCLHVICNGTILCTGIAVFTLLHVILQILSACDLQSLLSVVICNGTSLGIWFAVFTIQQLIICMACDTQSLLVSMRITRSPVTKE